MFDRVLNTQLFVRLFQYQFLIFNPWKVPWNWIAFSEYHMVCYITWLAATEDDLQTRPLRQMVKGLKITNWYEISRS